MDDEFAPRRASEWLLALSEGPDDADLHNRFRAWLAQSPAHATDWEEIARTYRVMGEAEPALRHLWDGHAEAAGASAVLPAPLATPPAGLSQAPSRRQRPRSAAGMVQPRRVFRAAAFAALAAGLAIVFIPRIILRLEADHLTETAASRTIQLDDGSTVHLAADTAVTVSFELGVRRVDLLKGEAFFEVSPDPSRPFVVTAGIVRTTVLGTAFDVRLRDSGADVGVAHGRVRVERSGDTPVDEGLTAGDWVRVDTDGDAIRSTRAPDDVAAWRRGEIVAKDRAVADVIDAIRPYYNGYIIVTGAHFARQPLTGVYRLSDPVEAVRAVARAEGATVRQVSPWVLIVSGD